MSKDKLFKGQKPHTTGMGDIILVQNELVTDLEQLAEELAQQMGVTLTEKVNSMGKYSRTYEKKRASPENPEQSVWYQLLCVPDEEPLTVPEERAPPLIAERLKAGLFEESMLVRYRGMQVSVRHENQGVYLFGQNEAFSKKVGHSFPYEQKSIDTVKAAVKKILDV